VKQGEMGREIKRERGEEERYKDKEGQREIV